MSDAEYEAIRQQHERNVNSFIKHPLFNQDRDPDKDLIEDIKSNKLLIYTAFTGDYDNLKDPEVIDENCDYVCFTDNPDFESDIWDVRLMENCRLDNNRIAKQYKVLPHKYFPDYKYSFWLDGSFRIKKSIREYIYNYVNQPMLNCIHPERDCIYDEAAVSVMFPRYPKATVYKQIEKYETEGMPRKYGLPVLGAIFRQHNNPIIVDLMNKWWNEISEFTNQDQLSLTYLLWKNDFHPSVSTVYYWINEYWSKEQGYHHKHEVKNPLTSDNLINDLDGNIGEENILTKEELYLLINDIDVLKLKLTEKDQILEGINKELNSLTNSSSWKVTKPLRSIGHLARKNNK